MPQRKTAVPPEVLRALPVLRRDDLRKALGETKLGNKAVLAARLWGQDPVGFHRLALFSEMTRERAIFLYKLNGEVVSGALRAIRRIRPGARRGDPETDMVVECLGTFSEPAKKRTSFDLLVHSAVKVREGSHPHTLERQELRWRNRNSAHVVFHSKDRVLEIRAKSAKKAMITCRLFGLLLFDRTDALVPIMIEARHFADDPAQVRFGTARIVGLDYHGTEELELRGSDVQSTMHRLRSIGDLDPLFQNSEAISYDDSILPSDRIRVYSNGKISILKSVQEPYEDILRAAIQRAG